MTTRTATNSRLWLFIAITLILSTVINLWIFSKGTLGPIVILVMWAPGIAAIAANLVYQRSLKGMGWKLGNWSSLCYAYLIPAVICCLAYGGIWAMGAGDLSIDKFSEAISKELGITSTLNTVILFLIIATVGFAVDAIATLGEEIGWGGFLTPLLVGKFGPARASLIVGVVWAAWHYPGILFGGYNSGTPVIYGICMFTLMLIGFSFIRTWLWTRSKSLWPAVVLHASHNLFIQAVFDQLTVEGMHTKYFSTEFGLALALVYLGGGFVAWRMLESTAKKNRD